MCQECQLLPLYLLENQSKSHKNKMDIETVVVATLRQTGSVHCMKHYSSKSSREWEKQFVFVTATEEKTNCSAWMLSTPSFLFSRCNIDHPSRAESIVKVHYCSSLYGIAIPESVLLMTVASPNPVWLQWASPVDEKEGKDCTTRPVLDCWARHFLCSHLLSPPCTPSANLLCGRSTNRLRE